MPTPLQILLDPVSLTVLAIYGALVLLEALFPARPLPRIRGWRTRALVVFTFYFFLSSYLPLLWRSFHQMHHSATAPSISARWTSSALPSSAASR